MSELQETSNPINSALTSADDAAKTHALIAYGLMLAGILTGILWLVGAIWAMLKKGDAVGTRFEDHYSNIISTFWWSLLFTIIGVVLTFFVIGYFVLLGVWIWSIYKVIKGLARITSNKPYH